MLMLGAQRAVPFRDRLGINIVYDMRHTRTHITPTNFTYQTLCTHTQSMITSDSIDNEYYHGKYL
jgi:hypothetical protein